MPQRLPQPEDKALRSFAEPESASPYPVDVLRATQNQRTLHHDLLTGMAVLDIERDDGRIHFRDNRLEYDSTGRDTFSIQEGDPLTAVTTSERRISLQRDNWQVTVHTHSQMSADATHFHVSNTLEGYEGDKRVFTRTWTFSIPRDLA